MSATATDCRAVLQLRNRLERADWLWGKHELDFAEDFCT